MTRQEAASYFRPTPDELDTLVEEVLLAALHRTWPPNMIDEVATPYFAHCGNGVEFETCPWIGAVDRFVAIDGDRRIHWMHAEMKARIAILDAEDFYPEVGCSVKLANLSRKETAEALDDHALSAMLRLARRQRIAGPAMARISRLPRSGTPAEAQARLSDLFAAAGIGSDLGWSLAQVALRVERSDGQHFLVHRCPFTRAKILARLAASEQTPRPDPAMSRRSLISLLLASDSDGENDLSDEVFVVASGIVHGDLPTRLEHQVGPVDLFMVRIERGDFDPEPDEESIAIVEGEPPEPNAMERAVATLLFTQAPISSHDSVRVLGAAAARLAAIGRPEGIDLDACRDWSAKEDEIPF